MQNSTQSDEVIVYLVDLASTPVQDRFSHLTAGEFGKIISPNIAGRKDTFATKAVSRQVIGEFLKIQPNSVTFTVANGKPSLSRHHDWFFNQSYSDSLMAIALAQTAVGVDIEWCKSNEHNDDVVDQFFHDEEIEMLGQCSGQERTKAFYRFWTRKEAVAKAAGFGASLDFALLNTKGDIVSVCDPVVVSRSDVWHLTSCTVRRHCALAVATATRPSGINIREWPGSSPARRGRR